MTERRTAALQILSALVGSSYTGWAIPDAPIEITISRVDDEEPLRPEPPPAPVPPKPQPAIPPVTQFDRDAMSAAEAKRARKNAKRARKSAHV